MASWGRGWGQHSTLPPPPDCIPGVQSGDSLVILCGHCPSLLSFLGLDSICFRQGFYFSRGLEHLQFFFKLNLNLLGRNLSSLQVISVTSRSQHDSRARPSPGRSRGRPTCRLPGRARMLDKTGACGVRVASLDTPPAWCYGTRRQPVWFPDLPQPLTMLVPISCACPKKVSSACFENASLRAADLAT